MSPKKLYIVIILCVVTPVLWAESNNQALKQNILEYFKHGLKSKYGHWRGTNDIFPLSEENTTTESTVPNKVRVEGVTTPPNNHLELNNVSIPIHLDLTRETNNVGLQNDTSKMLSHEPDWINKWHAPKVVFKSGASQNEIPLITTSKHYQKGREEPVTTHSPSPCKHGGTFVVSSGKYSCHCAPDYSGASCEVHAAICDRPLKPGRGLPCARRGKTCHPVAGGGFVCKSGVVSPRSTSHRNTSNLVECVGRALCPDHWECLTVSRSTDDYRCDPPRVDTGTVRGFRYVRSRRSTDDFCKEELCQHGADCKDNKCVCLINYTGKYCEKEVNYCTSNPCKEGVPCEPRLGGYNCDCPPTHMGLRCDIPKRITLKQMKRPRFLYFTRQYTTMSFTYCFYATSIGDVASVTVNFGDGITKCAQGYNFTRADDIQNKRLKTLFPDLNFLDVNPQLVVFKHTYKKTGYHNVTVEGTNAKHLVYTSVHTVVVDAPSSCKVTTKLRNCVRSVGANITEYNREDHIVILSDATVNCFHARLGFAWSLHRLNTKFDKHTPANQFHFGPEIATNDPHLNIYPYSLPFGVYAAQLNVTLRKPKSSIVESALTWFRVKEMKIVSRLVEGSLQQVHWAESAVLNASMSFNPNMAPGKQDNLIFTWTCAVVGPLNDDYRDEEDTFCPFSSDIPLATSGPIFVVPPRSLLQNWEYVFAVLVAEASESPDIHNLTESMTSVVVQVVTEHTPLLTIKCVRNCENDEVNPMDTAVLEAICSNCMTNTSEEVGPLQWIVTSVRGKVNSESTPEDEIVLMNHELGSTRSTLVLDEGIMSGHDRLIVTVNVKGGEGEGLMRTEMDRGSRRAGAERMINIATAPEPGYCNIVPQLGYAMLTSFHIFCYNFKDNKPPLEYEAMQFTNFSQTDTNLHGTLVGYEVESEIHDIRLAAGMPEYDHLTLIRTIVSSKYLYTSYDFNVTVFPVLYYLKSPIQVLNFLTHTVEDEKSSLVRMHDASSLFSNIQMIKVTAESAVDLLRSDYVRYIDAVELAKIIDSIKNRLANFLNQEEILSLRGLKHYATALDAILKLPRYHTFSPSNTIGGTLFGKVIDMLTLLKSKYVHFNKPDVEDLAPRLMSAASSMLRIPQDASSGKLTTRTFGFEKRDDDKAKLPNKDNQEMFANFTQRIIHNIFSYGLHILPYKANHEKGTLCESLTPDLFLSVQKNSPKSFNKEGLFIEGLVGIMPIFSGQFNTFQNGLSVFLLYIEHNPYWWHPNAIEINYPLVQLRMYDPNSNPVKVPTKVMMQNLVRHQQETIHGQLAIHPYWTLNDFDIQVTRIQVPKGGKLIVQFMPVKGHHKLQVIVKKGYRPELIDFWQESNIIPQRVIRNETILSESYTIYVDEESTSDEEFYYIGVLPHIDTLHALIEESDHKSSFPSMFSSRGDMYDDSDEVNDEKDIEDMFFKPKVMKVRERTNNTLPFEYAAYSIRCLALNSSSPDLNANKYCQVKPATTFDTVFCKCDDFETVTASFQRVRADLHMARSVQFYFPFIENPLTFYLIFFILILFFLLLLWALWLDRDEKPYRDIIFLADNDPRHSYFYLVIVQTGRRARAGTTSNVAIQLKGDVSNSQVHVLKSAHRPVLCRGSQEWFVLKTESALGNIGWINLWHDHLEASPYWYCSKVIVHDIQSNEVFFFFAEQWFTPLYMDGTMSCSVYNTADEHVFEKRYRFGESFVQAIGDGYHVWLSPFYKTPGGSYTRCQRVVVAFTHVLIMLLIIIHLFEWPTQDDDLSENSRLWTNKNLYNGVCTALIAFPLYFCLALAFMCVTPKPPWWYTPIYWRQYMTIDKPKHFRKFDEKDPLKMKNSKGDRYYAVAYTVGMTKSSDAPEEGRSVQPMIGRKTEQESFCLPHWSKYILWIVVSLFICIAVFFIYFNGVEHSTGTGYCTLVTLVIALLFSMIVLEMIKLIVYAIYHSIISRKEVTVEDRSDLALFLEDEYKVERQVFPLRLAELDLLRKEDKYRPIPEQRVSVLQRNAIKEASVRSMITDIGIVLLFIFLLLIAINGITDSLGFLNVRNVKNVIQGREGYGKTRLNMITEREGFLNYINGSLIPNLYEEENYNGSPLEDKGHTSDFTNYLVGVPRLRQIRAQEDDCKEIFKSDRNWANRCRGNYLWLNEDTNDYAPMWKKLEKRKSGYHRERRPPRGTPGDPAAWFHQTWWASATSSTSGVVTTYSGGGYVALLGRTRQASWQSLEYLRTNKWFDRLTVAVFLEFTLYNPNRNLVSAVRILAENTAMGDYTVHSSVQLVKVKPVSNIMPFIIFALFSLLVIALIICIHRDGFRIKKLRRWTYFGNIWYALNIVLAIMGLIVAFCLLERTLLLSSSVEKLREPNVNKYINFNVLQYWDQFLLGIMACMLFLVILQTWHLLSVEYKCHLVMTVLQVATHSLMCYAVVFAIFVYAFMMVGHLLFVTTAFQFRNLLSSFVAMVGFAHRNFSYASITHSSHNSMFLEMNWAKWFFLTFFLVYFFIFRWGFVLVLIEKFRRVSLVVQRQRWLEPVMPSFMQMNLASVRHFGRRGYSRSQADSLIDEYVRASFRDSLARLKAMERIVENVKQERKYGPSYSAEFVARSREIALTAMVIDHIEGKLQYKRRRPQAPEDTVAPTIRSAFAKERKANKILVTHLKMNRLEQTLDKLNDAVDQIIEYEEL